MTNPPGYPLPTGELGDDEIVCQLVYLPDRPEYWQAFLGALSYMTTWRAWERDDDKRGTDAAANWRTAFELTMECWRMTCLEDLKDDVAAILAIMQLPQSCCDEGDITDGDQYTDRVEDGVGDVPQNIIDAGYAEDAADWDGFDDYKCMIAHVLVSQISARIMEIVPLVDTTGAILGGVAALAGILAVVVGTGGLAIVFGIVAGIGATSLLYQALTDFPLLENLADKVDTNHDALACAVYSGDGDDSSLTLLNDKIDELFTAPEALILKNMNISPTLKLLYAGRYDQQDIADILLDAGYELDDFDCDCDQIGEYQTLTEFGDADWGGWSHFGGWIVEEGLEGGWCWRKSMNEPNHSISLSVGLLCDLMSLAHPSGTTVNIHRIRFHYKMGDGGAQEVKLRNVHDGGTENTYFGFSDTWIEDEVVFDPPLESTYNVDPVVSFNHTGSGYYLYVDRIIIDFDYVSG